jgi:CelD/BcsL family acetyltransferase involved in cellulose biosynthesis
VGSTAAPGALKLDTISSEAAFARLARDWDRLVRAMPRPSPMLLHGWVREWWRHFGEEGSLVVHVARRDGRLVGALPFCIRPTFGLRVLTFLGGDQSALADVLVDPGEDRDVAVALAERAAGSEHDYADLFGLPLDSRLVAALGPSRLRLIERVEAPVLELSGEWHDVYRTRMSSKQRGQHRRRRRRLAESGSVEADVARTHDELAAALEEAFRLHALRWDGRPDGSRFGTPRGMRFHRAAVQALADLDVARIVTLKLDGRPIAFHYFFLLERRMYVHRIAFDPAFSQFSPGLLNTLDAIGVAAEEGATRIEFLGGADRYKLELADRFEPMCEGFGLPGSIAGRAAVAGRVSAVRLRKQLKRSPALRRLYMDGLAPARRLLARLT